MISFPFRISILFLYFALNFLFLHVLAKFTTFSRYRKPISQFSILSVPRGNPDYQSLAWQKWLLKKTRTLAQENRAFHWDWQLKYFVINKYGKPHCICCPAKIKGVKAFNVEKHCKTLATEYACY